jgi:hypothetical protein
VIAAIIVMMGALLLCGCARDADRARPTTGKPAATAASSAITADAGTRQAAGAILPSTPSYEVAIASAQADRVHALNGCDGKQGASRAACVREADRAYDEARSAAEQVRGSTR